MVVDTHLYLVDFPNPFAIMYNILRLTVSHRSSTIKNQDILSIIREISETLSELVGIELDDIKLEEDIIKIREAKGSKELSWISGINSNSWIHFRVMPSKTKMFAHVLLETSEYVKDLRGQSDSLFEATTKPTVLVDRLKPEQRAWVEVRYASNAEYLLCIVIPWL